jgi:squalene-associated FAD-dependent desaturase
MTHVVVVGGGLAGVSAALGCADAGAQVTLLEKRRRLGGLTWSFTHNGLTMDNGQHVFLRCCHAYLDFLDRVGSAGDVYLQPRLDLTVLKARPGRAPQVAKLRRSSLRAPWHLAGSLARYSFVPPAERARLALAAVPLARMDLDDPELDRQSFETWLVRHFQGPQAISSLWDLICLPTVNLPAREASLAMAAKVFQTGLLTDAGAADIGWSRLPLGALHGERSERALKKAGAAVHFGVAVDKVVHRPEGGFTLSAAGQAIAADAVVVALPHSVVEDVLPNGALPFGTRPSKLASSPIVNVHVHFDRTVTGLPLAAALGTSAQWVFDRTASSGAERGQYLTVSVSAAGELASARPERLGELVVAELRDLFPPAKSAQVISTFVTREHQATFAAVPGSSLHRAPQRSLVPGLALAGAWTATGWPPTMEGAVRSGILAARTALAGAGHRERLPKIPEPEKLLQLQEVK